MQTDDWSIGMWSDRRDILTSIDSKPRRPSLKGRLRDAGHYKGITKRAAGGSLAGHDETASQLLERAHLRAPALMPPMKKRCPMRKTKSAGRVKRTHAAINGPQAMSFWPKKE